MTDLLSPDDLRSALRAEPEAHFRPVELATVIRTGRRRRLVRRSAASLAAVVLVASVAVAATQLGGGPRTTTPAGNGSPTASLSPDEHHQALVVWADCLRQQGIPGVTVVGPAAGSDEVTYLGDDGQPLPRDFRQQNGEWGSASEGCAVRVPDLLPELEQQWGDLTSEVELQSAEAAAYQQCLAEHDLPSAVNPAGAEAAGCVYAPTDGEAEHVLQCPAGSAPSGLRAIRDHRPWVGSPEAAGRSWVARRDWRAMFATVVVPPGDPSQSRLHVLSQDGRVTGVIYLLVGPKGWRLQSVTYCL